MTSIRYGWIIVALAAVFATQGGVAAIRARYEPRHIRLPKLNVTELPREINGWLAEDASDGEIGIDARTLRLIQADQAVTRRYVSRGRMCSIHLAMWYESDQWLPHPPMMCYTSIGLSPVSQDNVMLPAHPGIRVRRVSFQDPATGDAVEVTNWYQMGSGVYVERDEARDLRRSFWGQPQRPPLVKVLLQTAPLTDEEDRRDVERLAAGVFEFVTKL